MAETIALQFMGKKLAEPRRPDILRAAVRAGGRSADPFLPETYLQVNAVYDLSRNTRAAGGAEACELQLAPDMVVVLELADGTTVITSPARLQQSRACSSAGNAVDLGRLHEDPVRRGLLADKVSDVVSRLFTVTVGSGADAITEEAKQQLGKWVGDKAEVLAELGVTWLGTKALMWAVEKRLSRDPGLYRWGDPQAGADGLATVTEQELAHAAKAGPLLIFVHGTASSTTGSFGALRSFASSDWQQLEARFGERIYAFEHRTFSESPISNAVALARSLPANARINLVSHSRGGLVADLLCLQNIDDALIDAYEVDPQGIGAADAKEREKISKEAKRAYAEHRKDLLVLRALLLEKRFILQRYVRVACPARGTRLVSGNLDLFLSGLLTLIGRVPYLAGNPLYSAVKRIVLEIAKHRTNPLLVPGIEAMLPESPLGRLLAQAEPQTDLQMAVISGDIDTTDAGFLKKLGVLFTDYVFFNGVDNDLVVDTDSMYAGIAVKSRALARYDASERVSHFRYFENPETRESLRDWLVSTNVKGLAGFDPVQDGLDESQREKLKLRLERKARSRGLRDAQDLPTVVVLPGIMGTHLWSQRKDRIWLDPKELIAGGIARIAWGAKFIEAEEVFDRYYGDLCEFLAASHRVVAFPYDWRLPLDQLAAALDGFLSDQLKQAGEQPLRLLAHSMGGLVVRALIYRNPELMRQLLSRSGARVVMLGTPHQGSHSMVETLLGKADAVRSLARVDLQHDLQNILDIVAGFRGALQLLPRTGFIDTGYRSNESAVMQDYFTPQVWVKLKQDMHDFWFGDQVAAVPAADALREGSWLWGQDNAQLQAGDNGVPTMWPPALYKNAKDRQVFAANTVYVHGVGTNTACGIVQENQRWKLLGTSEGDGTVTWASGRIGGIDHFYFLPAEHGALPATAEHFPALAEILQRGTTDQLAKTAAQTRGVAATPIVYDAGPALYPSNDELATPLFGTVRRGIKRKVQALPTLQVQVKAMDLRFAETPILVGHYEQDPIAGAEALIDRHLVEGLLGQRYNMGMYAGPIGSGVVALRMQNDQERRRGSLFGAVVTGLGNMDQGLSATRLIEAVHSGVLRYLLHYADCMRETDAEIPLCSLLLGYNSSASLSIEAAVEALIKGVVSANTKYKDVTGQSLRINRLQIIELYLDTAISITHALTQVARNLQSSGQALDVQLRADPELQRGDGWRQRLDDNRVSGYWPRLMIGGYDRRDEVYPTDNFVEASPVGSAGDTANTKAVPGTPGQPAVAERLRFVHIGQRARAEVIVQQRQPSLVEKLVERQMAMPGYDRDFCRTLFQLLIPHEFKDAARQLERIVLVLDQYTANLPWELILADEVPLAARTAVIRQLASTRFRPQVRQTRRNLAYVIGNPSTEKFFTAFPALGSQDTVPEPDALDSLVQAESEAGSVVEVLRRNDFEVTRAIGQDQSAPDIINPLYKQPYRILHIAAHGIFNAMHRDGKARSGVVLSDGLLITAAEIEAMESVPDLVFLNCCHLAKIDTQPTPVNKLAYSISRELIAAGVRCVIAAGWPVEDKAAEFFAQHFYQALLQDHLSFGEAVHRARLRTYEQFPTSMTWGAYQAYGDPGWRILNGQAYADLPASTPPRFVDPEELLDRLARIEVGISRQGEVLSGIAAKRKANEIEAALQSSPAAWRKQPRVLAALGRLYAELGVDYFGEACRHYTQAIAKYSKGQVPLDVIEQLANLEARDGERSGNAEAVTKAIARLQSLNEMLDGRRAPGAEVQEGHSERYAVLGSAYKSKAAIYAQRILKNAKDSEARQEYAAAMQQSITAYQCASRARDHAEFSPYPVLNCLMLRSVQGIAKDALSGYLQDCDKSAEYSNTRYVQSLEFWDALTAADAELTRRLLNGELAAEGKDGDACLAALLQIYQNSLDHVQVKPKHLDSVLRQIRQLILFSKAENALAANALKQRVATRLQQLSESLQRLVTEQDGDPSAEADNLPKDADPPDDIPPDGNPPAAAASAGSPSASGDSPAVTSAGTEARGTAVRKKKTRAVSKATGTAGTSRRKKQPPRPKRT